jgi:glutaredoxin 2
VFPVVDIMTALYHFWSSPEAQRVRLALGYKRVPFEDRPLAYHDNETFFELGIARQVPVLRLDDGRLLTDSAAILRELDDHFPVNPVYRDILEDSAWQALLDWRDRIDPLLARLHASALFAFRDIGADEETRAAYKNEVRQRFGASVEELSNDRYAAWRQLERLADLKGLARRLARDRFYAGRPSAADMLLAADLFPLQLLDGVSLPIDLLYYMQRVEESCGVSPRQGLIADL